MAIPRHPGCMVRNSKLPPVVPLLALGAFLMCTTEFVIAGLLPQMAGDFGVRPSRIGLLIMAFAVGMIVGAPVMALATLRLPKRAALVLALATFAAGHVIAALSGSFEVPLAARGLPAVVTGAVWPVASVVATRAAGPDAGSRGPGGMGSGGAFAAGVGASSRARGVMGGGVAFGRVLGCGWARWPATPSAGAARSGRSPPWPSSPPR